VVVCIIIIGIVVPGALDLVALVVVLSARSWSITLRKRSGDMSAFRARLAAAPRAAGAEAADVLRDVSPTRAFPLFH
jgi:hypothetical protein